MKYVAKPVVVDAWAITQVYPGLGGEALIQLEDSNWKFAEPQMLSRYDAKPGDYWVRQSDDYEYINPKAVFERKYSPLPPDCTQTNPLVRKADVWWIVVPPQLRHLPGPFPHLEFQFVFWEDAFRYAVEQVIRQRCGIFS